MDRKTFINSLKSELKKALGRKELEEAIMYYDNLFDEAGQDNEAELLSNLGSPREEAEKIVGKDVMNKVESRHYFTGGIRRLSYSARTNKGWKGVVQWLIWGLMMAFCLYLVYRICLMQYLVQWKIIGAIQPPFLFFANWSYFLIYAKSIFNALVITLIARHGGYIAAGIFTKPEKSRMKARKPHVSTIILIAVVALFAALAFHEFRSQEIPDWMVDPEKITAGMPDLSIRNEHEAGTKVRELSRWLLSVPYYYIERWNLPRVSGFMEKHGDPYLFIDPYAETFGWPGLNRETYASFAATHNLTCAQAHEVIHWARGTGTYTKIGTRIGMAAIARLTWGHLYIF